MTDSHRRSRRDRGSRPLVRLLGAGPLVFLALFVWAFAAAHTTLAAISVGVVLIGAAVLVAVTASVDGLDLFLERQRARVEEHAAGFLRSQYKSTAIRESGTPEFQRLRAAYPEFWGDAVRAATEPPAEIFNALTGPRRAGIRGLVPLVLTLIAALIVAGLLIQFLVKPARTLIQALYEGTLLPADVARRWTFAVRANELPEIDLYLLLGCLALAVAAVLRAAPGRLLSWIMPAANWSMAADKIIQDRLRAAFERHADGPAGAAEHEDEADEVGADDAGRPAPVLPRMPISPTLADASADRLVVRSEIEQVRTLVFFLGAHAVAISGSRGVGKTTMLRSLTEDAADADTFGLMISAPVRYEPRDFMLHLYAQLCEAVLRRPGRTKPARLRRLAAGLMRLLFVCCVLAVLFPGTRELLVDRYPLPELTGTYVLLGLTCYLLARGLRAAEQTSGAQLSAEATRRLRQIRYLQTMSVEHAGQAAPLSVQLGWKWGRQWAEQPQSLPDVVAAYREFTTEVAAWWRAETGGRGKLVIAIDELDRIAEPELAETFLNEIKAIFGVEHCAYLVAVSEEALANFERRVVRARTVFDSAFDHIVHLRPMLMSDSVALLRNRVSGVPSRFWMLCHCLAGGMPRDVLRVARTMFELHRRSTAGSDLDAVATQLVSLEVHAVKRGFSRVAAEGGDPKLMADDSWPRITSDGLRAAADEQASTALAAALLYYSVVLQVFQPDTEPDWATDLARVHQQLATDPPAAIQWLRQMQADLAG